MDRDVQSPYFLGSIVLIKDEGNSLSFVVDGQQRLTTLTMLFCVLRELASGDAQSELDGFIREAGNRLRGTQDRFRLSLRARDKDFFQDNVQARGGHRRILEERTGHFFGQPEVDIHKYQSFEAGTVKTRRSPPRVSHMVYDSTVLSRSCHRD